jgi:hypothetical protein
VHHDHHNNETEKKRCDTPRIRWALLLIARTTLTLDTTRRKPMGEPNISLVKQSAAAVATSREGDRSYAR